jgi:hypothetical protein
MDFFTKLTDEFVEFSERFSEVVVTRICDISYFGYLFCIDTVTDFNKILIPICKKTGFELFWNMLRFYNWTQMNVIGPTCLFFQFNKYICPHQILKEPISVSEWKSVSSLYIVKKQDTVCKKSHTFASIIVKFVDFFLLNEEDPCMYKRIMYTFDDSDESDDKEVMDDEEVYESDEDWEIESEFNNEEKEDETEDEKEDEKEDETEDETEDEFDISQQKNNISISDVCKTNETHIIHLKETTYTGTDDYSLFLMNKGGSTIIQTHLNLFYSEEIHNMNQGTIDEETTEKYDGHAVERLFMCKIQNDYICRTCFTGYLDKHIEQSISRSAISFLYIEYRHPQMKYSIELELNTQYYLVGNELFTPLFIFRMLHYQPIPFLFDETYSIHLMDMNANPVLLDSFHYIKVNDFNYDIMDYLAHSNKNNYI